MTSVPSQDRLSSVPSQDRLSFPSGVSYPVGSEPYLAKTDVRLSGKEGAFMESAIVVPGAAQFKAGVHGLRLLDAMLNKLPRASWVVNPEMREYPVIPEEHRKGRWGALDPLGRHVFCIDGKIYFRRYNDNWNSTVMFYYPNGVPRSGIVEVPDDELIRLYEGICSANNNTP